MGTLLLEYPFFYTLLFTWIKFTFTIYPTFSKFPLLGATKTAATVET